jgi:hypothetical protein
MDVNEHERLFIITVHLDINQSKGTDCSKKGYRCK